MAWSTFEYHILFETIIILGMLTGVFRMFIHNLNVSCQSTNKFRILLCKRAQAMFWSKLVKRASKGYTPSILVNLFVQKEHK